MVTRESIAQGLEGIQTLPLGHERTELMLHAVLQSNGLILEELDKLRKELRTRNGGGANG